MIDEFLWGGECGFIDATQYKRGCRESSQKWLHLKSWFYSLTYSEYRCTRSVSNR